MTSVPGERLDALLPAEMAHRAEEVGVQKAALDGATTFLGATATAFVVFLGGSYRFGRGAFLGGTLRVALMYWFVYLRRRGT